MNCLITKTGEISECTGIEHEIAVKLRFKKSLYAFINGGVRVCDKERYNTIAIEHRKPLTAKQKRIVNRFLRENDYYCVADNFDVKNKIERPIRRLK